MVVGKDVAWKCLFPPKISERRSHKGFEGYIWKWSLCVALCFGVARAGCWYLFPHACLVSFCSVSELGRRHEVRSTEHWSRGYDWLGAHLLYHSPLLEAAPTYSKTCFVNVVLSFLLFIKVECIFHIDAYVYNSLHGQPKSIILSPF